MQTDLSQALISKSQAMRKILIGVLLAAASTPAMAQMDPYQIGMRYCQLRDNGVSHDKAWDYIVRAYANTSPYGMNRGDP